MYYALHMHYTLWMHCVLCVHVLYLMQGQYHMHICIHRVLYSHYTLCMHCALRMYCNLCVYYTLCTHYYFNQFLQHSQVSDNIIFILQVGKQVSERPSNLPNVTQWVGEWKRNASSQVLRCTPSSKLYTWSGTVAFSDKQGHSGSSLQDVSLGIGLSSSFNVRGKGLTRLSSHTIP